jgi:uncharacterized membrane protein
VRVTRHVRKKLFAGLLVVLPLVVTLWLVSLLLDAVDATLEPLRGLQAMVPAEFATRHPQLLWWLARTIGLLAIAAAIYLVGLLAAGMMGRRIVSAFERSIRRIPIVGGVYGASRQLLDAVSRGGSGAFTRCVLVEYPRKGLRTLAFVTREQPHYLDGEGPGSVSVFLPTTPNPTSGFFLLVPHDELTELDLAVDEGIKLIMSGGMIAPRDLGSRRRPTAANSAGNRPGSEEKAWTPS